MFSNLGTSYMLRHIEKHHKDIDFKLLPEPSEQEYEPIKPVGRPEGSANKRLKTAKGPRGRPKKGSKRVKSRGYDYMMAMRDEDSDDNNADEDIADDNDKAIKLLTGLLVKHNEGKMKRIEEYSDVDIEREMKEIGLKKARAELREVEIRIKEREERIHLYQEVKSKINLLANAAKVVIEAGASLTINHEPRAELYERGIQEGNSVLQEAFTELVHGNDH